MPLRRCLELRQLVPLLFQVLGKLLLTHANIFDILWKTKWLDKQTNKFIYLSGTYVPLLTVCHTFLTRFAALGQPFILPNDKRNIGISGVGTLRCVPIREVSSFQKVSSYRLQWSWDLIPINSFQNAYGIRSIDIPDLPVIIFLCLCFLLLVRYKKPDSKWDRPIYRYSVPANWFRTVSCSLIRSSSFSFLSLAFCSCSPHS